MTTTIYKQLVTRQDLALGNGKVIQRRNGKDIELDKIGIIDTVSSIADLRTVDYELEEGKKIATLGYHIAGDGGSSEFYWDATSIESDNNVSIIKITVISTGRFKLNIQNNTIHVKQAGAKFDGTDDTTAWQAAIDSFSGYEGTVNGSGGESTVVGTITLKEGVKLIGASHQVSGINNAKRRPRITHAPTIFGTNLFELETTGDYMRGFSVSGFSLYSATANSNNTFYCFQPLASVIENCDIIGFVDSIKVSGALDFTIRNTKVSGFSSSGLRFNDDTFVSTTTVIDQCHFIAGPWGVVIEENSIIDVTFKSCIFENCTSGGVDVYKSNTAIVNFITSYSENVPSDGSAKPIIQLGINGVGGAATKLSCNMVGGSYNGYTGGSPSITSNFINMDEVGQVTLTGVDIRRVGRLITTTVDTNYVKFSGCTNVSVVNPLLGIHDLSHILGEIPIITTGGYAKALAYIPKIVMQGGDASNEAWDLEAVFANTAYDLIVKYGGTEKFRWNNEGDLSLGSDNPNAKLDVTGDTLLGAISVAVGSIGNSQINMYISEASGNLIINAKKADGSLYTGSVSLTLVP